MGDSCWMHMTFRRSDLRKITDILGPFDQTSDLDGYVEGEINEINYGGLRERQEMAEAGIPFYGQHSAGGEYGEHGFVSFGGELVDVEIFGGTPVIIVNESDLTCLENVTAGVSPHISNQIKELRKYYDFLNNVKEAFRDDVQVTSA